MDLNRVLKDEIQMDEKLFKTVPTVLTIGKRQTETPFEILPHTSLNGQDCFLKSSTY